MSNNKLYIDWGDGSDIEEITSSNFENMGHTTIFSDNDFYITDDNLPVTVRLNDVVTDIACYYVDNNGNKSYNYGLTDVKLGNSITCLNDYAFKFCYNLSSVSFNDNLKVIGNYSFSSCKSLSNINFKDNVETIGDYAFDECSCITLIDLKNVKSIGKYSFSDCYSLKSISGLNITSFTLGEFSKCSSLTKASFPNVIKIINESNNDWCKTFAGCTNLTSVNFEKLTNIGPSMFSGCDKLLSLNLPEVTEISCNSSNIPFPTNLTSINLPKITSIDRSQCGGLFYYCSCLTSLSLPLLTSLDPGCIGNYVVDLNVPNLTTISSSSSLGNYSTEMPTSLRTISITNMLATDFEQNLLNKFEPPTSIYGTNSEDGYNDLIIKCKDENITLGYSLAGYKRCNIENNSYTCVVINIPYDDYLFSFSSIISEFDANAKFLKVYGIWWGDSNQIEEYSINKLPMHTYANAGKYVVTINNSIINAKNIFKNKKEIIAVLDIGSEIEDASSMFEGCLNITGPIPSFSRCTSLKILDNCFSGCSNITRFYHDFELPPVLSTANNMFESCVKLKGNIPSWPNTLKNCESMYLNCKLLSVDQNLSEEELMPSTISSHSNAVSGSSYLEQYFTSDWGGSKSS